MLFSPDGHRLTCGAARGNKITAWAVPSGKKEFETHTETLQTAAAYTASGKHLICGDDSGRLRIYDAQTGREEAAIRAHDGGISALTLSRDGQMLITASEDKTLKIWDWGIRRVRTTIRIETMPPTTIALTPNKSRLLGLANGRIYCWTLPTGQLCCTAAPTQPRCFALLPRTQQFATGSAKGIISLWDVSTGKHVRRFESRPAGPVRVLCFTRDGGRLMAACDDGCHVYRVTNGREIGHLMHPDAVLFQMAYSPDGGLIATEGDAGQIQLWDARTLLSKTLGWGHCGIVHAVAWSPKGDRIATVGHDGTLRLWDPASGRCIRVLDQQREPLMAAVFSSRHARLATDADGGCVSLWSNHTYRLVKRMAAHCNFVRSLVFSPADGTLCSLDDRGVLRFWDPQNGSLKSAVRITSEKFIEPVAIEAVTYAPDGKSLACITDHGVAFLDVATRRFTTGISVFNESDFGFFLRREPAFVLVGRGGEIRKYVGPAHAHRWTKRIRLRHQLMCAAISPDERLLAVGDTRGAVILIHLDTGFVKSRHEGHDAAVYCLAFSPDGSRLASSSEDGTALIWDVRAASRIDQAGRRTNDKQK